MKDGIRIDFNDLWAMRDVMNKYGDDGINGCDSLSETNDEGELNFVEIFSDSILVRTYQHNGWTRINQLRYDGTSEELFDGRWDK